MTVARAYKLEDPKEVKRMFDELLGYLKVCAKCGTDHEGRQLVREAIEEYRDKFFSSKPLTMPSGK